MKKSEIKKKLLKEIDRLKNKKYGFIAAGMPSYNRLFGRDSLITSWQLLDLEPEIAKNTLKILAKYQGKEVITAKEEEPGKILHEHQIGKKRHPQSCFPFPYYGSVDSTPLFLILFSFYYKKTCLGKDSRTGGEKLDKKTKTGEREGERVAIETGDTEFLKKYWKNVLLALHWVFHFGDKDEDYFLEYERKAKKGLFHQGWKDGFGDHLKIKPPVAVVEVQGYQYLALIDIAKIAGDFFGDGKLEKSLRERAEGLRINFNKKFWMEKEKYFAFALDGEKEQVKEITSNPGHLLFTGILDKNKEKFVVKKLFSPELWTPFGIRTHSIKSKFFDPLSYHLGSVWPHDNWLIAQGLKKLGYKKEYREIKKALLRAYKRLGLIPEFYAVLDGKITLKTRQTPCYPQAWATGALLNFLFN